MARIEGQRKEVARLMAKHGLDQDWLTRALKEAEKSRDFVVKQAIEMNLSEEIIQECRDKSLYTTVYIDLKIMDTWKW